jgi:hypothetical protein
MPSANRSVLTGFPVKKGSFPVNRVSCQIGVLQAKGRGSCFGASGVSWSAVACVLHQPCFPVLLCVMCVLATRQLLCAQQPLFDLCMLAAVCVRVYTHVTCVLCLPCRWSS